MSKKIYTIGFYVLLAMNIMLVIFITQGPKKGPRGKDIKQRISQELNFDASQKADFEKMANNHGNRMRELERDEKELMNVFFSQLSEQNTLADTIKDTTLEKIKALKEQKIIVTYQHFEELKSLCNEDQLANFDEVIKSLIPLFTSPGRRPPGKERRPRR